MDTAAPAPDKQAVLRQAISHMPPVWRDALEATLVRGLSPAQLAKDMGKSEADVADLLREANRRLGILTEAAERGLPQAPSPKENLMNLISARESMLGWFIASIILGFCIAFFAGVIDPGIQVIAFPLLLIFTALTIRSIYLTAKACGMRHAGELAACYLIPFAGIMVIWLYFRSRRVLQDAGIKMGSAFHMKKQVRALE